VALNDLAHQRKNLESLREHLSTTYKRDAYIAIADVSSGREVEGMVADVAKNMGSVDVMVANAGIAPVSPIIDTSTEDFQRIFKINVEGVFHCYKFAALQMIKQGHGGKIIGASSTAGKQGWGMGLGNYSSTKFAVRGLTQSAAREFQQYGITVNAYAPGFVTTELANNAIDGMWQVDKNQMGAIGLDESQFATTEDVAGAVSFLVSDDAAKITGQSLMINNGYLFD
jgi:NAD(P)-dependent dehydrogenase (short-subunit alcohol dehydrogenase family)